LAITEQHQRQPQQQQPEPTTMTPAGRVNRYVRGNETDTLLHVAANLLTSSHPPTERRRRRRMSHNVACTHPFNGPFSRTTRVGRYQKGKTNPDFTEARDSEWQWHQLGRMQVCTSLQTDNHASTSPLSFLQTGCPSCCPTNSVEALKAK